MTRTLIFTNLALLLATSPASAACLMSYCQEKAPTRSHITTPSQVIVSDLYSPGHDRRIQIRDTSQRIVGYVTRDGKITNTHRQKIGTIEELTR